MRLFILIALLAQTSVVCAQKMILAGKITYEKKFSVIKSIEAERAEDKDDDNSWYDEMIKVLPKYKTDIFALSFNTKQAIYKTLQEDENERLRWYKYITNVTHLTNFVTDSFMANRTIYDMNYLLVDSTPKPSWKITGEYREIAGYQCRRATTIVNDSVFIIAFFTEAIPVSGGPDIYSGLPGMVLGVVLPRFHTTIFATSVETVIPLETDFVFKPIRKAKQVSRSGLLNDLSSNLERWGKYGERFILKAMFN